MTDSNEEIVRLESVPCMRNDLMAAQEDPDKQFARLSAELHEGHWSALTEIGLLVDRLTQERSEMETIAHGFEGQDTLLLTQHDQLKQDYTAVLAEHARLKAALGELVDNVQDWIDEDLIIDEEPLILHQAKAALKSVEPST